MKSKTIDKLEQLVMTFMMFVCSIGLIIVFTMMVILFIKDFC